MYRPGKKDEQLLYSKTSPSLKKKVAGEEGGGEARGFLAH